MTEDETDAASIDFAVAAYREEGTWVVAALPERAMTTALGIQAALRQLPGEGGVFGLISVGDEFFMIVRTIPGGVRTLISDSVAVLDWTLAQEVAEAAGLEWDDDDIDDLDELEPIGDLAIASDFGMDADEMLMLCEDEGMYPEEQVRAIAKRLGFARDLSGVLGSR